MNMTFVGLHTVYALPHGCYTSTLVKPISPGVWRFTELSAYIVFQRLFSSIDGALPLRTSNSFMGLDVRSQRGCHV